MSQRKDCSEDHTNPPNEVTEGHRTIGVNAGWSVFEGFLASDPDVTQTVKDQIAAINADYQQNEFAPRQQAANAIYDLLNGTCTIDGNTCPNCGEVHGDMDGWRAWRAAQYGAIRQLGAEVDAKHNKAKDDCYNLVGETAYAAYLAG